jgi:hypothetical protein
MNHHIELGRRFLEVDEAKDPEATAIESYIASISGTDTGVAWAEIFAALESVIILGTVAKYRRTRRCPAFSQ